MNLQQSNPATDPNMKASCKLLMEQYDKHSPGVGQTAVLDVENKPTFIIGNGKYGVGLRAQYGQLKQLGEMEELWTGVDMHGGTLKESLIKLDGKQGIGDSLQSDNVDTNLIFQFLKANEIKGLIDRSLDIDDLKNTSGRQCTMVTGPYRKDLAKASYPPMAE